MDPIFLTLAFVTLAAAVAAMTLRNLIHCALALALVFIGLAAVYLRLNAQFLAFAQLLIYVGAVAILIVFAILLTRGGEKTEASDRKISVGGLAITGLVAGTLIALIAASPSAKLSAPPESVITVKDLGHALMSDYILALEVIGLLLTAALIGGIIIALPGTRAPLPSSRSNLWEPGEAQDTSGTTPASSVPTVPQLRPDSRATQGLPLP